MTPQGWKVGFSYPNQKRIEENQKPDEKNLFKKVYDGSIEMGEVEWLGQMRDLFEWLDHHHRFSKWRDLRMVVHGEFPRVSSYPSLKTAGNTEYTFTWPAPIIWSHTGPTGMVSTNLDLDQYTLYTGAEIRELLTNLREQEVLAHEQAKVQQAKAPGFETFKTGR